MAKVSVLIIRLIVFEIKLVCCTCIEIFYMDILEQETRPLFSHLLGRLRYGDYGLQRLDERCPLFVALG